LEALVKPPLCDHFDLIFGTSTGAIIAALIALGYGIDEIHQLYKKYVPTIMRARWPRARSRALTHLASSVFGDRTFNDVKTGIGIVATRWIFEKPMIFKASVTRAHGRHSTFVPGFGCTLADAVRASCSAYPFFERAILTTSKGDKVELIDGGYCANNPTLYAIADAVIAFEKSYSDLRVVSLGVGVYPEPRRWARSWLKRVVSVRLLQKTLNVNTSSMEQLRDILFRDIQTVRINETFESPEMATDLLEHNLDKLNLLYQRGGESFAKHERELKILLGIPSDRRQTGDH
jgi:predicted acylesterase/phospholipase RssA